MAKDNDPWSLVPSDHLVQFTSIDEPESNWLLGLNCLLLFLMSRGNLSKHIRYFALKQKA